MQAKWIQLDQSCFLRGHLCLFLERAANNPARNSVGTQAIFVININGNSNLGRAFRGHYTVNGYPKIGLMSNCSLLL